MDTSLPTKPVVDATPAEEPQPTPEQLPGAAGGAWKLDDRTGQ